MHTILALETSTETASVALLTPHGCLMRASEGVQNHSLTILPMVQEVMREAGLDFASLSGIAFGAGPGSFTGVRSACALAQGMGFAHKLPLLPVVTLQALAQAAWSALDAPPHADLLCLLDARMEQVYWAQYRRQGQDWLEVAAPALSDPVQVMPQPAAALYYCGNPAQDLPQLAACQRVSAVQRPHAQQIAQLGLRQLQAGLGVAPADAQPLYLRNKVAQTSAERAAKAHSGGAHE
ncbi:tRNA (adenosine(37)-N6)-threonylcarbamoyltransferase complex dimerization subunit type 1 TsaB [Massilia sp. W12]|uniref:tRNA (adenosine(37)-N6)-threonylcarbamoyltransferase complex dimerization subunit type 1 TsaB n=1 Tax=Massilia sp. W12 TaxID=3126507 RepID=UPI0030D585FD